jgi:aldehyde:ferredoxin oxidoreductase
MSFAGGFFGPEFKKAGYDGIVIQGRAKDPVYLQIIDDEVTIKDASHLWGRKTSDTQAHLRSSFGSEKVKTLCIGPAGENLVRFAGVFSDNHAFGRGGSGAIMGSKNLKAIVVKGTKKVPLYDEKVFEEYIKDIILPKFKVSERVKVFGEYGTPGVFSIVNIQGILPTKNYQQGTFDAAEAIDGDAVKSVSISRKSCYRCPVACRSYTKVQSGEYGGYETEGPEYETMFSFGSNLGNANLESIIAANKICQDYGLDTISTGNVLGFATECFEKGLLTKEDTGDVELRFGNHRAMIRMIKRIAVREGFGAVLAEGVKRASDVLGKATSDYAMEVKGLEMSGYDPRGAKGMAIAFATAPRGGCHQRGLIVQETFGAPPYVDRFSSEGKGALAKAKQDEAAIQDALGFCVFISRGDPMGMTELAEMFTRATGVEVTVAELLKAGERIWNIERLYNLREGFTRKDDRLPKRFLEQPMAEGPSSGHLVELDTLLDDYYAQRGWDEDGHILPSKLEELGLPALKTNLNSTR